MGLLWQDLLLKHNARNDTDGSWLRSTFTLDLCMKSAESCNISYYNGRKQKNKAHQLYFPLVAFDVVRDV